MQKNYRGGIFNPLNTRRLFFEYEVIEQSELSYEEWEDVDRTLSVPKRNILLKALGGSCSPNEFYVTVYRDDAKKPLRPGEIISAVLEFHVRKAEDGVYVQEVTASDIYTLNDYQQLREVEAAYQGGQEARRRENDN